MLSEICDKLSCAPVHHLGKTLILFRQLPGNIKPAALAALEPNVPPSAAPPSRIRPEARRRRQDAVQAPGAPGRPDEAPAGGARPRPASSTRTASPCARAPARHPAAPTRFRAARAALQPARRSPQRHQPPLVVQALSPEQAKPSGAAPVCAGLPPPGAFRLGTARDEVALGAAPSNTGVGSDEEPAATKRAHYAPDPISGPHVIADCR